MIFIPNFVVFNRMLQLLNCLPMIKTVHEHIVCVKRVHLQIPYSFPLQGSIQMRLNCLMQGCIEERGFLVSVLYVVEEKFW